jgi:hypothetical protein
MFPDEYIASLIANDVRKIHVEAAGCHYGVDISPDPEESNLAHTKIIPSPQYKNDTPFKKVKDQLSRLAKIVLEPLDQSSKN